MDFKIVFIDDNLTEKSSFVQTIRKHYPQADYNHVFEDPNEGLQYVLDNLNSRLLVFIDWNFSAFKQQGIDVLKSIREKTSLLYIVMMSANQLGANSYFPPEALIYMMNDEHFYYLDRSNKKSKDVFNLIDTIQKHWKVDFDCILEQWLVRHNDKAEESIMVRGNRNITWSDMLSELRNQTDVGKDFERMMNQYYLRVFKDKSEI